MTEALIDRIVRHVLDTPFEALSESDVLAAKKRLIDTMGCALSGVAVVDNDAVFDLYRGWGGSPEAAIPGRSERLPLPHAALICSLQVRSFDFEVCGPEAEGVNLGKMVGHVSSTTEPVALAVGEYTRASGRELLAAVVLGGDVAARVSVSNEFDFDRNFEVCGTSNAFGAAAIAGRLLGLDHGQLRNAFGILLNLLAGSFQGIWDGVHSFKLPGAMAAYNGILACQLSLRGFSGVKDAFESRLGYFAMYCHEPAPQNMVAELGEVFYVHGAHKLHPSCYGIHNPIECVLQIRAEHEFDASEVTAVELDVPPNQVEHFLNQVPTVDDDQPKSLFTIPYGIANALLRGRPELEHYVAPAIYEPEVLDLAGRVRLVPSSAPSATAAGESIGIAPGLIARVRIYLTDGRVLEAERSEPLGWLGNPTPMEAIVDKFWRNARFSGVVSEEQARRALDLIETLEDVSDVAELADALSTSTVTASAR